MTEKWELILGNTERNEMSRIVKADDHEFIIGYLIRECRNKEQQAEDDKRAKLIASAPEMAALLVEAEKHCPTVLASKIRAWKKTAGVK